VTPSVTPTNTPSPSVTPTQTPTPSGTGTPTPTPTNTPTPSIPLASASLIYGSSQTASQSTYTFTGLTYTSGAFVVVAVEYMAISGPVITSATLGGATLSGSVSAQYDIGVNSRVTQVQLLHGTTTNTSGNLVVNLSSSNVEYLNVSVYQTSGLVSPTQIFNQVTGATSTSPMSITTTGITGPSLVFAASSARNNGVDWTYSPFSTADTDALATNTPNGGDPGLRTASGFGNASNNITVTGDINPGANILRVLRVAVYG
jgi:hypothetical protein